MMIWTASQLLKCSEPSCQISSTMELYWPWETRKPPYDMRGGSGMRDRQPTLSRADLILHTIVLGMFSVLSACGLLAWKCCHHLSHNKCEERICSQHDRVVEEFYWPGNTPCICSQSLKRSTCIWILCSIVWWYSSSTTAMNSANAHDEHAHFARLQELPGHESPLSPVPPQ